MKSKPDPRRVLVTGASRGIGRAVALDLAASGHEIAINYLSNEERAREVAGAIESAGGRAYALPFDVSDPAAARAAIEADIAERGAFWGCVLNAGRASDSGFAMLTEEAWSTVVDTNLGSFYNVLQPLTMPMVRLRDGGRIVVMSSVSGLTGNAGQVNYAATKAGLIGAAKSLAQELAKRHITVNCVAPGYIATDMVADLDEEEVTGRIPMKRMGRPEEVAAAVAYLFSEGAGYVTGQTLSVNGGLT